MRCPQLGKKSTAVNHSSIEALAGFISGRLAQSALQADVKKAPLCRLAARGRSG